jgi:hypothetical protein
VQQVSHDVARHLADEIAKMAPFEILGDGSDIADSVRYLEGLDRPLPRAGRKTGAFHH